MEIANRKYRAVVTGATRGIGFAIAERLLNDACEVIATGTKAGSYGPEGSIYQQVDFLDDESIANFIVYLKEQKIDILVNNAGINKIGEFSLIDIKDFDQIWRVNLRAPFQLCQAVIPGMKQNNWGRIINLTSIFGNISKEYRASYSSSKFGLDGMTAALSAEVSEFGILANSVGPGFIDTDLTRRVLGDKDITKIKSSIPMKRLGQVDEIASLVSWLVSEENTYISGQNLMIDGGFSRV
jgi:NAD(P)-dependent dehydrogenase (short-subunit alcohol dehydrogenase family)